MRKAQLAMVASLILAVSSLDAANYAELRRIVTDGGTGRFNCAFKGKRASKPCTVSVKEELVRHPDFVSFHGKAERASVITVQWPDGDLSKYTWMDSGEMLNLGEKEGWGYHLASDEWEQDWSRGFVIESRGSEHIRIW
jgi:hypothetical protein